MSNETNETPGARLSEAQVEAMAAQTNHLTNNQAPGQRISIHFVRDLLRNMRALLADRAAQVAEVARLEAQLDSAYQMLGEVADELTRVEDQNLEMRPLVEALAEWLNGDTVNVGWLHTTARALVATWQTPAAPTPDGREGDD